MKTQVNCCNSLSYGQKESARQFGPCIRNGKNTFLASKSKFYSRISRVVDALGTKSSALIGILSIFLVKSIPCQNTEMNTALLSSIMTVADVTIAT